MEFLGKLNIKTGELTMYEGPEFEARAKEVASWTPVQLYVRGLITTEELQQDAPGTTDKEIDRAFKERDARAAEIAARSLYLRNR